MVKKDEPSRKREKLLRFFSKYQHRSGRPPSIREMVEEIDVNTTSAVHHHVNWLVKHDYLDRERQMARGLRLTKKALDWLKEIGAAAQEEIANVINVRLVGDIVAGQPVELGNGDFPTYDPDDTVAIDANLLPRNISRLVALRVRGNSMIDAGVNDRDIVILEPVEATGDTFNGEMVAAWLRQESEMTLKYFFREKDQQVRLQPANPFMEPITMPAANVEVQGRVVFILHRPGRFSAGKLDSLHH